MRARIAAGTGALGLILLLALVGCSSGEPDQASSDGAAVSAAGGGAGNVEKGPAAPVAAAPDQRPADTKQANTPARFQADPRAIVYNGSITVRVDRPDQAAGRVSGVATGADGFVGSDKRTSDDDRSEAILTLRVPAAKFAAVVDELARLGKEESRQINTEDVTEQVVDLDARLVSQRASVNRTRALLAQARTIGEIVSIESELAKREGELGVLEARKRNLDDLTTLSTITVTLLGPDAKVAEPEPTSGFVAGLKAGWKAFLSSMRVLLTVVGVLLPWLVILGIPVAVALWLSRRLRRRPTPATPDTTP